MLFCTLLFIYAFGQLKADIMIEEVLNKFWDKSLWLPPNTTWEDLTPAPDKDVVYNDYRHLLYPIPMAIVIICLRKFFEAYLFVPFGKSLGIKDTTSKKVLDNPKLEAVYQTSPQINHKTLCALAKQSDMTERQVERWWRLRRSQDKPSKLVKFCEDMWRFTFYFYNFSYGAFVLWEKIWLWNIDYCFIGYPHQGITNDIWWYYMVSSAYYWSLMITQFCLDVKRKDFWQMLIHHLATIALLYFSWVCNFHRIGTLVILSHDCNEIFMEAAKASKYANYQRLCNWMFAIFTISWFITRLGYFPFKIIWCATVRFPTLVPMFPAYYIFNLLLYILLSLHLVWTWLILRVAYKSIICGNIEGDLRSSSSEADDHPMA